MTRRQLALLTMLVVGLFAACVTPRRPAGPVAAPTQEASPFEASSGVDFSRLRREYGARDNFSEVCERNHPLSQLFKLADGKRWGEAIAVSQAWLAACPVDIDVHYIGAVALNEVGRTSESQDQVRWFRGLVDSVLASGDGRSPATAFVVISVPEEYSVLRALGLRYKSQALLSGRVDALTVERENGSTGTVYFKPAAHFERLQKQLRAPR